MKSSYNKRCLKPLNRAMIYILFSVLAVFILTLQFINISHAFVWSPENTLREYILDNYPWENIEITGISMAGKVIKRAPDSIVVEKGPLGRAVFSFIYGMKKKVIVKANVKAMDTVVKSMRPFRRGHIIGEGDIYISQMDIRKMPSSSIKNPDTIIGKPLKRSISANVPIAENMVEKSKRIKKGQKVMMMLNFRGMTIKTLGKTGERGYVGMPIRVINLSSNKEVVGVLINENTVKVEL